MITHTYTHTSKHAIHLPLHFTVPDLAQGQCVIMARCSKVCMSLVQTSSSTCNLRCNQSLHNGLIWIQLPSTSLKCAESVKNTKQPDNVTSALHHHCSPQNNTSEPCLNHEIHVTGFNHSYHGTVDKVLHKQPVLTKLQCNCNQ